MFTDLFLLIGALVFIMLNNPTLRIKTSPRRSNPSPRLFTHNQHPISGTNSTKALPSVPLSNGAAPTSTHTKRAAPKRGGTQTLVSAFLQ